MALCLESRTPPPFVATTNPPHGLQRLCCWWKKGDLHAPFFSRVQQKGPLHGPVFAQKHPYMRRCSTPPSTPSKLLHRSHECHEYPPLFLAKFAAKISKRAPRAPLKSRAVTFRRRVLPETGRRWGNPYYFSVRNSVFISCAPLPPSSSLVLKNNHSSLCIENRRFTINRSNFISYFGGHP